MVVSAKIRIDVRQMIGRVSPLIYGQFLEHIGRAIYGGVYEPGNPLSDKDGFRLDVLDKIAAVKTKRVGPHDDVPAETVEIVSVKVV